MVVALEVDVLAGIHGRSVEVIVEALPGTQATVAFPITDLVTELIEAHTVPGTGMVSPDGREALVAAHEEMIKSAQVLQSALGRDHALAALRRAD